MKTLARGGRAFGRFWWEFLIGETPELFAATVVIVVVALLFRHDRGVGLVVLPLIAVVCLVVSTLRGRKGSSGST
jgi:hypothetical protein